MLYILIKQHLIYCAIETLKKKAFLNKCQHVYVDFYCTLIKHNPSKKTVYFFHLETA